MQHRLRLVCLSSLIMVLLAVTALDAIAQSGSTQISVARENQPAPDGMGGFDGTYDRFFAPVLNDAGEIAFAARMDTSWNGLFRTDGTTTVVIAREGQAAPDANGNGAGFFTPISSGDYAIADNGKVAFENFVDDASGAFLAEGIWIGDGTSLEQRIRTGDPAPDGNGVIDRLYRWYVNDVGKVAVAVSLAGTSGGTNDNSALLLADGSGLITLAREGSSAPGPGGPVFSGLSSAYPFITDNGAVFFNAGITEADGSRHSAVYIFDGTSTVEVARSLDDSPAGGRYSSFNSAWENFNEAGQIPWNSTLVENRGLEILFRGATTGVTEMVREGDSAPDLAGEADGTFSDMPSSGVFIAGNGDIFFAANVADTASGYASGLFRSDGSESEAILFRGSSAPNASDFFNGFNAFGANERGQLLIDSILVNESGFNTDRALFLHDMNAGLVEVARSSDTLAFYDIAGIGAKRTDPFNGLNERGQVAYTYSERSITEGIALFDPGDINPPEVTNVKTNGAGPNMISLFADVSDSNTGGQTIASAEYQVDGGDWFAMRASDLDYDEVSEAVVAFNLGPFSDGSHEFCIRATDALGWTSSPVCISEIVGGGEITGLMARCLHDPVYLPAEGQLVTIRAEAVDGLGNPVTPDSIQIFLDSDRENPQVDEALVTDTVLEIEPDASFAYACRVTDGTESFFSGWKRVSVGEENEDFPAIPVRLSGNLDERIDIVFFHDPDEYTGFDDPEFIDDVGLLIDQGFFTIPWYVRWQKFMNFWIAKDPADTGPRTNNERCKRETSITKYPVKYAFADSAGLVHRSACRDNAGFPGTFTIEMDWDRLQVVAHEVGHRPFGLADEYCCDGGYFTKQVFGPLYPNLFKEEPGCRDAAIDGGFDPDSCRSFQSEKGLKPDWWLYEEDRLRTGADRRDVMQGTGCASATKSTNCEIQLTPVLGTDPDPNGLVACDKAIETFYVVDADGDGANEQDPSWICRKAGSASEAIWELNVNDRGADRALDRARIRESERRRMFWFIGECLKGNC